jgi:hypothetical protein
MPKEQPAAANARNFCNRREPPAISGDAFPKVRGRARGLVAARTDAGDGDKKIQ